MLRAEADDAKGSPIVSDVNFGCKRKSYSLLLDTGADLSLLDKKIFQEIPSKNIRSFDPKVRTRLNSASGHKVMVSGKAEVKATIQGVPCTITFCIVDGLKCKSILGSDFVYKHQAMIDFAQNTLQINGKLIILRPKSELPNVTLLQTTNRVEIAPYSIHKLQLRSQKKLPTGQGVITPLDTAKVFLDNPGVMAPNIQVEIFKKRKFPMAIVNNTGCRYFIRQGTCIAVLERLDEENSSIEPSVDMCEVDLCNAESECADDNYEVQDGLSQAQAKRLDMLLQKYDNIFAKPGQNLPATTLTEAKIDTKDHPPIKIRPYRNPLSLQAKVSEQIQDMVKQDIIRPSSSPWSFPIVVVCKKDDPENKAPRICVDYRALNRVITQDSYPLPKIDEIFATLGDSKFFSTLDLKSSYHQIPVAEQDREKTAFCCHAGLYEFNRLPSGISIAPSIFQRLISKVLNGIEGVYAVAYLDDICIYSKTFEDHLQHIENVIKRLEHANMVLKKTKCVFGRSHIEYLGHVISKDGIAPNPDKVRAVQKIPPPKTVKQVRSILGLIGYYRGYIPHYAEIARPLTLLTRKHVKFEWSDEAEAAFQTLKKKLMEAPILAYANPNLPYNLYTDSSQYAIGGILCQEYPEGERVVAYVSHQLAPNKLHWPIIEKECLAICFCVTKLKQYLLGADIRVYCDHKPLKQLFVAEMKNTRVQRYAILLDEYNVKIFYKKGRHNARADALSRLRLPPTAKDQKHEEDIFAMGENGEDTQDDEGTRSDTPEHRFVEDYEPVDFGEGFDMKTEQTEDEYCQHILEQLQKAVKARDMDNFLLHNGLLYHIGKVTRLDLEPFLQLVVPETLQKTVIQAYHCDFSGGHVGLEKTYHKIKSRYFWQNMYKDVVEFLQTCVTCQRRMLKQKQAQLQESVIATYPTEVVGVDLVGPMPRSMQGNEYLLTVVDWYSNWVEAYPIPNKEAETVVKKLAEKYIPDHGFMKILISDRGTEFCNQILEGLAKTFQIERRLTTPYHPAGNGRTERIHRFLGDIIAKGVQDELHNEWEDMLPSALFAIRTSINTSTRYSPYFLTYGRDPVLPLDTILKPRRTYYGDEYVPTLLQRLHTAFSIVERNTREARATYKKYADKKATQGKFEVGDPVYWHNPVLHRGEIKKFQSPWTPYFRIVEMTSPVNAIIRSQKTGVTKKVHVSNLRHAKLRDWDLAGRQPEVEQEPETAVRTGKYELRNRLGLGRGADRAAAEQHSDHTTTSADEKRPADLRRESHRNRMGSPENRRGPAVSRRGSISSWSSAGDCSTDGDSGGAPTTSSQGRGKENVATPGTSRGFHKFGNDQEVELDETTRNKLSFELRDIRGPMRNKRLVKRRKTLVQKPIHPISSSSDSEATIIYDPKNYNRSSNQERDRSADSSDDGDQTKLKQYMDSDNIRTRVKQLVTDQKMEISPEESKIDSSNERAMDTN